MTTNKMMARIFAVQILMLCSATMCWANSCSSVGGSGKCSIDLKGTNLEDAVAAIMAKVRSVLPVSNNRTAEGCRSCWDTEGTGNTSQRNASAKINQLITNINTLVKKLKEDIEKANKTENLKNKVKEFGKDRDWPSLKQVLEDTLKEGDPALDQARSIPFNEGKDVLMHIVISGHKELLQKLLDLDLDANLPWGMNNSTMLHTAVSFGKKDIAEVLYSRGALVDVKADYNTTPLHRAAASRQSGLVQWLINKGADVHATDSKVWTPLHHAARFGDLESVKILVAAGAVKEALNGSGATARDLAEDFNHKDIADFLAPDSPFKTLQNAV